MEYKSAKEMTVKEPGSFRKGGRWRGHLRGEKTGRLMWMKRSFKAYRDKSALIGLEVDMAYKEQMQGLEYDDLTGGKHSSFALVETAVRLYGKNPDHYQNASFEEMVSAGDQKKLDQKKQY